MQKLGASRNVPEPQECGSSCSCATSANTATPRPTRDDHKPPHPHRRKTHSIFSTSLRCRLQHREETLSKVRCDLQAPLRNTDFPPRSSRGPSCTCCAKRSGETAFLRLIPSKISTKLRRNLQHREETIASKLGFSPQAKTRSLSTSFPRHVLHAV